MNQSNNVVIDIKDLSFGYTDEKVLKEINLEIYEGDFLGILGKNGSGKSTLLKLILGKLKAQTGQIYIYDKEISQMKDFKRIGYIPQINISNKVSFPITCEELVVLNQYRDFGFFKIPRKKNFEKAHEMLAIVGMSDYNKRPFNQLSGGQQQKVMIARSMINDPSILILDEPTVGIDQKSKVDFFELLISLNEKYKTTIIMVTHEMDFVSKYISKKAFIENGELIYATV